MILYSVMLMLVFVIENIILAMSGLKELSGENSFSDLLATKLIVTIFFVLKFAFHSLMS